MDKPLSYTDIVRRQLLATVDGYKNNSGENCHYIKTSLRPMYFHIDILGWTPYRIRKISLKLGITERGKLRWSWVSNYLQGKETQFTIFSYKEKRNVRQT